MRKPGARRHQIDGALPGVQYPFYLGREKFGRSKSETPTSFYKPSSLRAEQERFISRRMESKQKDPPAKSHFVLGFLWYHFTTPNNK